MIQLGVSIVIVLTVSFLCSLAEAALLSINVNTLSGRTAEAWRRMKNHIGRPIAAILILNTIANTGGATIAGSSFDKVFGEQWLWAFSIFMTVAILIVGEILPKTLGVAYGRFLAAYLTWPLETAAKILTPVIHFTELITNRFDSKNPEATVTTSDIITMASMARAGKAIGCEQENIIVNAIRLSHSPVRTIMSPRETVHYVINGISPAENRKRLGGEFRYTRYPLCANDSLDSVIGVIPTKKLSGFSPDVPRDFREFTFPSDRIDENSNLLTALRELTLAKKHILMVENKNGKIVGMLTLEDITSELIGFEELPQ